MDPLILKEFCAIILNWDGDEHTYLFTYNVGEDVFGSYIYIGTVSRPIRIPLQYLECIIWLINFKYSFGNLLVIESFTIFNYFSCTSISFNTKFELYNF